MELFRHLFYSTAFGRALFFHNGFHPLGIVQNPLAQPDVFGSDFHQLIVADKLQRILQAHAAGRR